MWRRRAVRAVGGHSGTAGRRSTHCRAADGGRERATAVHAAGSSATDRVAADAVTTGVVVGRPCGQDRFWSELGLPGDRPARAVHPSAVSRRLVLGVAFVATSVTAAWHHAAAQSRPRAA